MAGPGTLMRNLDVVFAFFFELLILHEPLYWTSYVGATLIIVFTVLVGVQKYRHTVKPPRDDLVPLSTDMRDDDARKDSHHDADGEGDDDRLALQPIINR
jgi:hypothetical protein